MIKIRAVDLLKELNAFTDAELLLPIYIQCDGDVRKLYVDGVLFHGDGIELTGEYE